MFVALGGWFFRLRGGRSCAEGDLKGGARGCQSVCMGVGVCGRGWVFRASQVTYGKQPVGLDAITASVVVLVWLLWLAMPVRRLGCVILVKQDIKTGI